MKKHQHQQLLSLAENPKAAAILLSRLDKSQRLARALWDVYCVALLTIGQSASA